MAQTFLLFAASAGAAFGQNLKKGALVGQHVLSVDLKPGVTMDQLANFLRDTYIPAVTKEYKGVKGLLVKGIRGERQNQLAILWVFPTEAARDKYFTPEGPQNELGQSIQKRLEGVDAEPEKLAAVERAYTDWVVQ